MCFFVVYFFLIGEPTVSDMCLDERKLMQSEEEPANIPLAKKNPKLLDPNVVGSRPVMEGLVF